MNKILYSIVASIRVLGEFFTKSPIIKKIAQYLTANTQTGITFRLWLAVLIPVSALLFDVFYLQEEFKSLPAQVPLLFDVYGNVIKTGDKSAFEGFTEARVAFFLIMVVIGWVICKVKGGTLMAQRIRLLVVDIANLAITTGVGMATVYMEIAKGNTEEKLAEEWEYSVMIFWLLTLIFEFIVDRKHILSAKENEEQ